jgi:hypothetical protein
VIAFYVIILICYTWYLFVSFRYTVVLGRMVADLACITDTKRTTMADDLDIDALLEAPYDKVGHTLGYRMINTARSAVTIFYCCTVLWIRNGSDPH